MSQAKLERLLTSFPVPVTRPQWQAWLDEHLDEFRARMQSAPLTGKLSATDRRRQRSVRVRARSDLPAPARRIQPQAEQIQCHAEWALNLENRMGWHGIKTRRQGVLMLFLMHLRGRTYCLTFRNRAATGPPTCRVDSGIAAGLVGKVKDLAHLETLLIDDEVLVVWEFQITGVATGNGGVTISAERSRPIRKPKPAPPKTTADEGEEDDADEDDKLDKLNTLGSDAESCESNIVDTDAESDEDTLASSMSARSSDDDAATGADAEAAAPAPAAIGAHATGGAGAVSCPRPGLLSLWNDDYFWIWDSETEWIQMKIRSKFAQPAPIGMGGGTWPMSKRITPRDYGETRAEPVRSILILRAWAVWRARLDGWADERECRKTHFDEQEVLLERDVRALGAPDRLLGNAEANALLRSFLPDLVVKLQAS